MPRPPPPITQNRCHKTGSCQQILDMPCFARPAPQYAIKRHVLSTHIDTCVTCTPANPQNVTQQLRVSTRSTQHQQRNASDFTFIQDLRSCERDLISAPYTPQSQHIPPFFQDVRRLALCPAFLESARPVHTHSGTLCLSLAPMPSNC